MVLLTHYYTNTCSNQQKGTFKIKARRAVLPPQRTAGCCACSPRYQKKKCSCSPIPLFTCLKVTKFEIMVIIVVYCTLSSHTVHDRPGSVASGYSVIAMTRALPRTCCPRAARAGVILWVQYVGPYCTFVQSRR